MKKISLKRDAGVRLIQSPRGLKYLNNMMLWVFLGGLFFESSTLAVRPYIFTGDERWAGIAEQIGRDTGLDIRWRSKKAVSSNAYIITVEGEAPKDKKNIVIGRIPRFPAVNLWNSIDNITRDELGKLTAGKIVRWNYLGGKDTPIIRIETRLRRPGKRLAASKEGFAWLDWTQLEPGVKILSVEGNNPLWDRMDGGYPYWGWLVLSPPKSPSGFALLERWRRMRFSNRVVQRFSSNRWVYGQEKAQITAVGDMLFDRGVSKTVAQKNRGYSYLFEKTAGHLLSADITIGNLECPLSQRGRQINMFRGDPEVAGALHQAGFDIVSLANNHILDYGVGAFEDTLTTLIRQGITPIGAGLNYNQAGQSLTELVNSVPLAFFAYTEVRPGFTYARVPLEWRAGADRPGVNSLDEDTKLDTITWAKRKGYKVIVSVHWGAEYQAEPDDFQRRMAQRLKAAGADLVIGHHPHVTQGVAVGPQTIAYSLGNFIFDQKSPERREGLMLDALLDREGLRLIRLHPIRIYQEQPIVRGGNMRRFQLRKLEQASRRLVQKND